MAWRVVLQLQRGNNVGETALRSPSTASVRAEVCQFGEGLNRVVADSAQIQFGGRVAQAVTDMRAKLEEIVAGDPSLDEILERALSYITDDDALRSALAEDLQGQRLALGGEDLPSLLRSIAVQSVEEAGTGLEPWVHILTMHSARGSRPRSSSSRSPRITLSPVSAGVVRKSWKNAASSS